METQPENNASSVIPDWWIPPVSGSDIDQLLLIHENSRRIDGVDNVISLINEEAREAQTSINHMNSDSCCSNKTLTGIRTNKFGNVYYRWDCEKKSLDENPSTENSWIITEEIYLSSISRLLFATAFALVAIISLASLFVTPSVTEPFIKITKILVRVIQMNLVIITFLIITLLINGLHVVSYDIIGGMEKGYRLESNNYLIESFFWPFILMGFGGVIKLSGRNPSIIKIIFSSILLISAILISGISCMRVVRSKRPTLNDISPNIDLHTTTWLFYISIFGFGSAIMFGNGASLADLLGVIVPNPFYLLLFFIFVSSIASLMLIYVYSSTDSITARWKRNQDIRNINTKIQISVATMTTLVVYGGLWSLRTVYVWLTRIPTAIGQQLSRVEVLLFVLVGVLILPPAYLISGLIRQVYRGVLYLKDVRQLIRSGTRLEDVRNGWDGNVKYPVIVVDSTLKDEATAVEAFGQKAIVISRSVEYQLEDDQELAAILAHEEAHLEHGDTRIRSIAPFVGTFLGLSNAVIYAILDFRKREYRADAYACRKESPEDLLNAIDTISDDSSGKSAEEDIDFRGTPGVVSSPSEESGIFYPLFSNYTISSHPVLDERKKAIDPSRKTPPDAEDIQIQDIF